MTTRELFEKLHEVDPVRWNKRGYDAIILWRFREISVVYVGPESFPANIEEHITCVGYLMEWLSDLGLKPQLGPFAMDVDNHSWAALTLNRDDSLWAQGNSQVNALLGLICKLYELGAIKPEVAE